MSLSDKVFDFADSVKKNPKQVAGFFLATGGSYLIGLLSTELMRRNGLDPYLNASFTWLMRTASFYSINIPYHLIAHKDDYKVNLRDSSREKKVLLFSNGVGTAVTLAQKPAHAFLMQYWDNIPAYLIPYSVIGGLGFGVKFGIDWYLGVCRNKAAKEDRYKHASLEKVALD